MKTPTLYTAFSLLTLCLIFAISSTRAQSLQQSDGCPTGQRCIINIPVIRLETAVTDPSQPSSPTIADGGSDPANPYAVIRNEGPQYAAPGAIIQYQITLANYEMETHRYELTETIPDTLEIVPESLQELSYDSAARQLHWSGSLPPGYLEYVLEESEDPIPYLDLETFGVPNLCDGLPDCHGTTVVFNLGVNGYAFNLYGQPLTELVVSANGLISADDPGPVVPQWLPDANAPGSLLAGLWRDTDMSLYGRWHAAIIAGLLDVPVFYIQWHDAPQANNPDDTARFAIALALDNAAVSDLSGHAFFIYDNIAHPEQTIATGYVIGTEDTLGERGLTYAYAPCCGQTQPPIGYPPSPDTVLHLRPTLFYPENEYKRTFTYQAIVRGHVPETIATTARAVNDSVNPAINDVWSTHYLSVRLQQYFPVAFGGIP
jgi:hypothetical protein